MAGPSSAPADEMSVRLTLYNTAVEMADRMSARRWGANTFFFTLHAGLAAIVGISAPPAERRRQVPPLRASMPLDSQ